MYTHKKSQFTVQSIKQQVARENINDCDNSNTSAISALYPYTQAPQGSVLIGCQSALSRNNSINTDWFAC